jgi:predicted phosphate transport protein (TIGR00153 family)
MLTILNLFGRSPFALLKTHMDKVSQCVHKVTELFDALQMGNEAKKTEIAQRISELEHQADLTKNDIRNHLPKSLFLAIDRQQLLEILAIQDSIADRAEDVAVLATLKMLTLPESLKKNFQAFLQKNIDSFQVVRKIMNELHDLLESSFGGIEAEKVRSMVEEVSFREHEADLLQHALLRDLIALEDAEGTLKNSDFYLWTRVFQAIADISNLSEKLANRMRMTLDLK